MCDCAGPVLDSDDTALYVLVSIYFAVEGLRLGQSTAWRRVLHNRGSRMLAVARSVRADGTDDPAAADAKDVAPAAYPAKVDRLIVCLRFAPGVSPGSNPQSQRRTFWAMLVTHVVVVPGGALAVLASDVLPGGTLRRGLVVLLTIPALSWGLLAPLEKLARGASAVVVFHVHLGRVPCSSRSCSPFTSTAHALA